jgi:hypothetical protein
MSSKSHFGGVAAAHFCILKRNSKPGLFSVTRFYVYVIAVSNFTFLFPFQVGFCTMCRARCAAITAPANTTGSMRAMAARVFSNDRFVATDSTCANQSRTAGVWSTRRTATSAGRVG